MKNHELYFAALMAGVLLVGCERKADESAVESVRLADEERETNHEVESLLQDYERLGASERAAAELQMAEALDACNAVSVAMREGFTRTQDHRTPQMATREGLQFALRRADFPLARRYAESILADEPDNLDANFAVGMDALIKEDYALAEKSLSKCVEKKSAEPALWNNLAVLKYRQGRYDEALQDAKKAESLAPDSVEIQDTIRQIKAAGE